MLTFHELMGFMSPKMANQILEDTYAQNREVYRVLVTAVAQAQKLRPVFLERQPRTRRHEGFVQSLSRVAMEEHAGNLIRGWLFKEHQEMLSIFLDALDIKHDKGMVDDVPDNLDEDKLKAAVELLVEKYPRELVVVYLTAFNASNAHRWENLDTLLAEDPRLQLGE